VGQPELLPGLSLSWLNEPAAVRLGPDSIAIAAGPQTDWFSPPDGDPSTFNAPAFVGMPQGDFLLSARVTVEFGSTFDAGVLVLFARPDVWAKLCFEYSPDGEPMVASVVTRGVSDDCNSFTVDDDHVWLRIARIGSTFAFHASFDGAVWTLVRHFALPAGDDLRVGFEAQSPTGLGCTASFSSVRYSAETLADIRSGA
jgi:uncharacterized protein